MVGVGVKDACAASPRETRARGAQRNAMDTDVGLCTRRRCATSSASAFGSVGRLNVRIGCSPKMTKRSSVALKVYAACCEK